MTHSGFILKRGKNFNPYVLIPLLLDDPLWTAIFAVIVYVAFVLIPLLLDDPLWIKTRKTNEQNNGGLNPSFAGWPTLGIPFTTISLTIWYAHSEK